MSTYYLGAIVAFAGNYAPEDWMLCQGQTISIQENQALFSLLGTTYGGDGVNNFGLPNLCGRVPIGAGAGPNLSPRILGQTGGSETVVLDGTQLPPHTHNLLANTNSQMKGTNTPAPDCLLGVADDSAVSIYDKVDSTAKMTTMNSNSISSGAGALPHSNVQPSTALNYIICVRGVYPPRP